MTQHTDERQHLAQATASVTAKLGRFSEGLTPDERAVLGAALWRAGAGTQATEDVAGYRTALDIALSSVERLPIWGGLQDLVNALTQPIDWGGAFNGSSVYIP